MRLRFRLRGSIFYSNSFLLFLIWEGVGDGAWNDFVIYQTVHALCLFYVALSSIDWEASICITAEVSFVFEKRPRFDDSLGVTGFHGMFNKKPTSKMSCTP